MASTSIIDLYLLPPEKRHDRMSRMLVYLTLAACFAGVAAATLTMAYGYQDQAITIYLAAISIPVAIPLLRLTDSILPAAHYLAANLFLQTLFFSVDAAVGCVTLIALATGAGLLHKQSGQLWLAIIMARCVYVGIDANTELESATAAVSALASLLGYIIVRISEKSRRLASLRARTSTQQSVSQMAVLQRLITEHFDAQLQVDNGQISYVSKTLATLLGYAPDEILARPLSFFLHPEDKPATELLNSPVSVEREEIRLRHADGRWIWVEAYIAPDLRNQKAQLRHIVLRNYDQQKQASEQLTEAQRLDSMGVMAAAAAHDFNNMLTVILGFADDLPEGTARSEITRVASSAASLSNKLLTFGHGQLPTNEVINLSHVMREHSTLVRHAMDSRYILIESYQDEPALVRIDSTHFEQVFLNLLNNAREAMPEGGEVEISLYNTELEEGEIRGTGAYAVVEVRDTGCGMDEETMRRAFDPFFTTKSTKKTSGLGLSSCYGIVAQYGGFIDLDSTPGQGTTASVYLPLTETQALEPVLELIDNDATIIVVDDDAGVLGVVTNALGRKGYRVRGFTEAEAAIEFFDRANVCLLVTDVVMPSINGSDLASRLRAFEPELPVLFISGFTEKHLADWQLNEVTLYLAKPFRAEEIIDRVGALLRASAKAKVQAGFA